MWWLNITNNIRCSAPKDVCPNAVYDSRESVVHHKFVTFVAVSETQQEQQELVELNTHQPLTSHNSCFYRPIESSITSVTSYHWHWLCPNNFNTKNVFPASNECMASNNSYNLSFRKAKATLQNFIILSTSWHKPLCSLPTAQMG